MATNTSSGVTPFWLIAGTSSARIESSPGVHSIVELTVSDSHLVSLDDRDLNDNESLREAIQAALDGHTAPGYQGDDLDLTAAQDAADAAWDAHEHCAACGASVPSLDWLSRDGKCGRCFIVEMGKEAA